ncbi:hypothetical protein SAMN06295967_105196 [Belliella buryatensis]|uniref:Uncharacterized protein n=1 Tax=Belliella buryatensis TaxID=1500549 RepID=A0A239CTW3_9BACT|nr:hypothetical protein SAMN06295967_105196 [Belliella buryatensis]
MLTMQSGCGGNVPRDWGWMFGKLGRFATLLLGSEGL